MQIFNLYKTYGNKWVEIAKHLNGRTENWVKNLYYATLRRYVRNINKLKEVQDDMKYLRDIDVNEKMLGELLLLDHVDFKVFQSIDSPEFKLLSKKVGKCRRRKDIHLSEYLFGETDKQTRRKSKATKSTTLTDQNIETLDEIKKVLELLQSTKQINLQPVRILRDDEEGGIICKSRPRRRSTLKKEKVKAANPHLFANGRRRSKRIQENIKRNSKEFQIEIMRSAQKEDPFL